MQTVNNQPNNHGILRMTPRSQLKFFHSLQRIYEEQDCFGKDYIEEPNSPEYTIVSAIDDSCVLFAVKDSQSNENTNFKSD